MGTRYYEPSLGRFSSRDVLFGEAADPMSLNQFVYAGGSPVTFADPTGGAPVCRDCTPEDEHETIQAWANAMNKNALSDEPDQSGSTTSPFDYLNLIASLLPQVTLPFPTVPVGPWKLRGEYAGPNYFGDAVWSLTAEPGRGIVASWGPMTVTMSDFGARLQNAIGSLSGGSEPLHGTMTIGTHNVEATGRVVLTVGVTSNWFQRNVLGRQWVEFGAKGTMNTPGGGRVTVSLTGSFENNRTPPWIPLGAVGGVAVSAYHVLRWVIQAYLDACGGASCPVPV
jgi:hypothetical protein